MGFFLKTTFLASFVLMLVTAPANAQPTDLRKNKKFFKKKLSEYDKWLDQIGFSEVLVMDGYQVNPTSINFRLKGDGKFRNPEFMAKAWLDLRKELDSAMGLAPEKMLLEKLASTMEVSPELITLEIVSTIPSQFQIVVGYQQGSFYLRETMGEIRGNDDRIKIHVKDLRAIGGKEEAFGELETAKKLLLDGLLEFYRLADSKFGNTPKVDVLLDRDQEFTLLISNISDQVIDTYFELINLNVRISQQGEEISISYTVFGKYSSGIFLAPRITSSDYQDMYPKYSAELSLYIDKLGQQIQDLLKKQD